MIQAIEHQLSAEGDRFCRDLLGDRYLIVRPDRNADTAQTAFAVAVQNPGLSSGASSAIAELVHSVALNGIPQLRRVSEDQFAWAVPVNDDSYNGVAIEFAGSQPDELAALINRSTLCAWSRDVSARQLSQQIQLQDEQLMAYAAQVTEDLEELTWLRSLACNLELSESGNSIERIADTVLPSLCRQINAFSLVFVRDVAVAGMDGELPVIWQTGRLPIPRESCLSVIARLLGTGRDRTVVRNFDNKQFVDEHFSGVKSCVLVPVATETARLGWLLAVNKDNEHNECSRIFGDVSYKTYMSEQEFGSFEASLMNATAVVLAAHGRNCGLFHEKELLLRGVIRSMINAIDAKDSYTCGHSDRVAEFSRLIAKELSLDFEQCEEIYMTGLLHDVGKIGVPDHVLKKPGQLTDSEFEQIKQHPVIGYEILKHLQNLSYVLPGVLHHHEAIDGSGYPHGLKGDQIPLYARILAVADSYDAMTSNRPYRCGMPTEKAEAILRAGIGTQWDSICVDAFFRTASDVRQIASQRMSPFSPGAENLSSVMTNS